MFRRVHRPPLVEHHPIQDQHAGLFAHALGHAQARGAEQEIQPIDMREGALCGRSRPGRKGLFIFASNSASRSRGRKWYFPAGACRLCR